MFSETMDTDSSLPQLTHLVNMKTRYVWHCMVHFHSRYPKVENLKLPLVPVHSVHELCAEDKQVS